MLDEYLANYLWGDFKVLFNKMRVRQRQQERERDGERKKESELETERAGDRDRQRHADYRHYWKDKMTEIDRTEKDKKNLIKKNKNIQNQ